ncbi:hypothetical protein F4825DRAFT_477743 [Nemania diffusa]|nr:hypothetical protein F4825DRAFT_477743 [Nemania diffusa]
MAQPQPLSSSHERAKPNPYYLRQPFEPRRNGNGPGSHSGFRPSFGAAYPRHGHSGRYHLDARAIPSTLLPAQKEVLAMSREQYLNSLSNSADTNGDGDNPEDEKSSSNDENGISETGEGKEAEASASAGRADKLSVGVCVFRLDEPTGRPAVLLLRRSPAWWQARVFSSSPSPPSSAADGRPTGAGEWELPGGKVARDDFSISAALERLVRAQTGLQVTKVMGMLSEVRWTAELKVLLWNRGDGAGGESSDEEEDGEWEGFGDEVAVALLAGRNVDSGVDIDRTTTYVDSGESEPQYHHDTSNSNGDDVAYGHVSSSSEGPLSLSSLQLEILGVRVPSGASLPARSSPVRPASECDFGCARSSVLLSTKEGCSDPSEFEKYRLTDYDDNDDNNNNNMHDTNYDGDNDNNDHDYTYVSDSDHDATLEPAPLSLPGRANALLQLQQRPQAWSSTTLPASSPELLPRQQQESPAPARRRSARRNAAVIPYKMVRRAHVQLHFTVLVDEEEEIGGEETVGLPGFLLRCAEDYGEGGDTTGGGDDSNSEGGGGRGKGKEREKEEIFEHDALEWATAERVQELPMREDLRRVVLEGLRWLGELEGGFI